MFLRFLIKNGLLVFLFFSAINYGMSSRDILVIGSGDASFDEKVVRELQLKLSGFNVKKEDPLDLSWNDERLSKAYSSLALLSKVFSFEDRREMGAVLKAAEFRKTNKQTKVIVLGGFNESYSVAKILNYQDLGAEVAICNEFLSERKWQHAKRQTNYHMARARGVACEENEYPLLAERDYEEHEKKLFHLKNAMRFLIFNMSLHPNDGMFGEGGTMTRVAFVYRGRQERGDIFIIPKLQEISEEAVREYVNNIAMTFEYGKPYACSFLNSNPSVFKTKTDARSSKRLPFLKYFGLIGITIVGLYGFWKISLNFSTR